MAVGTASGFGLRELQGITMDVEDHVDGRILDGRIRIGRGVFEEPNDLVVSLIGGSSFLCGNGFECNENGGIDRNGIVQ